MVFLKNETTLFKHITLHNILNHIGATSTGGKAILIRLQQGMLSWWFKDPRVPEFITRFKEAQWKARQASLAISYAGFVAVASRSLLTEKISLTNNLSWKGYHLGKVEVPLPRHAGGAQERHSTPQPLRKFFWLVNAAV